MGRVRQGSTLCTVTVSETEAATVDRDVWVVGATSILGWTLANTTTQGLRVTPTCSHHNRAPQSLGWHRLDVEQPLHWRALNRAAPDIVVYCAGVCDVRRCEEDPAFAQRINVGGVAAMLDALPAATRLVVCSSDHVFGGRVQPYRESTPPDPISAYGRTRLAAERLVLGRRPDAVVVRVALPIGPSMNGRVGHLDWLRDRQARGLPMTIIEGESRAAVWADDAARRVMALARSSVRGVRHLAATQPSGRPQLAAALCDQFGIPPDYHVTPRETLDHPHLGHVDLQTDYDDALATPLHAPIEARDRTPRIQTPGSRASHGQVR